jgi:hypothetical protein
VQRPQRTRNRDKPLLHLRQPCFFRLLIPVI